jgi:hypothetical protein
MDGTNLNGYVLNVQPGANFTLVPEPGNVALLVGLCLTGVGWRLKQRISQ